MGLLGGHRGNVPPFWTTGGMSSCSTTRMFRRRLGLGLGLRPGLRLGPRLGDLAARCLLRTSCLHSTLPDRPSGPGGDHKVRPEADFPKELYQTASRRPRFFWRCANLCGHSDTRLQSIALYRLIGRPDSRRLGRFSRLDTWIKAPSLVSEIQSHRLRSEITNRSLVREWIIVGTFLDHEAAQRRLDTRHVPRTSRVITRAPTGPAATEAIANIHLVAVDIRRRDGRRERKRRSSWL
jgi:hypothetical protein